MMNLQVFASVWLIILIQNTFWCSAAAINGGAVGAVVTSGNINSNSKSISTPKNLRGGSPDKGVELSDNPDEMRIGFLQYALEHIAAKDRIGIKSIDVIRSADKKTKHLSNV